MCCQYGSQPRPTGTLCDSVTHMWFNSIMGQSVLTTGKQRKGTICTVVIFDVAAAMFVSETAASQPTAK